MNFWLLFFPDFSILFYQTKNVTAFGLAYLFEISSYCEAVDVLSLTIVAAEENGLGKYCGKW